MNVSLIGSGNVAFQLAKIFTEKGVNLLDIRSRNIETGAQIAALFKVVFSNKIYEINPLADIVILAVSDDAIDKFAENLHASDVVIAHTSGTQSIHKLSKISADYGSFYPLQTFTKNRCVNFSDIPVLVDGSNNDAIEKLQNLAKIISDNVHIVSDEKRMLLHPAAVMVNNFTNHLFALSEKYCEDNNLDFNLLKPLMKETVEKALDDKPISIQTGPAKRKDFKTIEKHLSLIHDERLKAIYQLFTESIQKTYE